MLSFLKKGFSKTFEAIKSTARGKDGEVDKDELEEALLEADVDYEIIEEIFESLPSGKYVSKESLEKVLNAFFEYEVPKENELEKPYVELVLGVNGAGKTTTIAKLAKLYKKEGFTVILGAADTFRAAAIEQLKRWAQKISVPIVYTKQGHDPSAVAYDTISSAKAKLIDRVIIDTAGRLQNQTNLIHELNKIKRSCDKAHANSPHRKLLIIDGTQGNSAIAQAKSFHELVGIDAIIITKLDGTAKGGALFGIVKALKLPILYVGVGEKEDDLIPFEPKEFVGGIIQAIFPEVENG